MDLKLPHLGEGADSGTVVNLFVKEGDQLAEEQPVLELENEKAVATIPSTAAGTVTKVYVKPGDKLSVGQRILALNETGATAPAPEKKAGAAPKEPAPAPEHIEERQVPAEEMEGEASPAEPKPGIAP